MNSSANKFLRTVLLLIFYFTSVTNPAFAYISRLSPQHFNAMYNLAARGNLSALSSAQSRGLNIDAVNEDGDTGLCVAVKRRNATAYNSFRSLGANPAHPCTQRIPYYRDFVSSRAVQSGATWYDNGYTPPNTPRIGKPSITTWLVGAILVGGGIAIAAGGGGGGGGGSDESGSSGGGDDNPGGDDTPGGLTCQYGCAQYDTDGNCIKCNDAPEPDICETDPCAQGCYTDISSQCQYGCAVYNKCGGCEQCNPKEPDICATNPCAQGCYTDISSQCQYGCAVYNKCGGCEQCNTEQPDCSATPCAQGCYTDISSQCTNGCASYNQCGGCEICNPETGTNTSFVKTAYTPLTNTENLSKDGSGETSTWGGIYSQYQPITNSGNITLTSGENAVGIMSCFTSDLNTCLQQQISVAGGDINNTGEINIKADNSYGIFATTLGKIDNNVLVGMGSINTSNKGIYMYGSDNTGIALYGNGNIINDGTIYMETDVKTPSKEKTYGSSDSTQASYRFIDSPMDSAIYYNNSTPSLGYNIAQYDGDSITSTITNNSLIKIKATSSAILTHDIDNPSNYYAEFAYVKGISASTSTTEDRGSVVINNTGNININYNYDTSLDATLKRNYRAVGIQSKGNISTYNDGDITLSGNTVLTGIAITQGGYLENRGDISINIKKAEDFFGNNGIGIYADKGNTIYQYGDINATIEDPDWQHFYAIYLGEPSYGGVSSGNNTVNIMETATINGNIVSTSSEGDILNNYGTINGTIVSTYSDSIHSFDNYGVVNGIAGSAWASDGSVVAYGYADDGIGTLTNHEGATINGGAGANTIINDGTIIGSYDWENDIFSDLDGPSIDAQYITNNGNLTGSIVAVDGTTYGYAGVLTNTGTINASYIATTKIENTGTINALEGFTLKLYDTNEDTINFNDLFQITSSPNNYWSTYITMGLGGNKTINIDNLTAEQKLFSGDPTGIYINKTILTLNDSSPQSYLNLGTIDLSSQWSNDTTGISINRSYLDTVLENTLSVTNTYTSQYDFDTPSYDVQGVVMNAEQASSFTNNGTITVSADSLNAIGANITSTYTPASDDDTPAGTINFTNQKEITVSSSNSATGAIINGENAELINNGIISASSTSSEGDGDTYGVYLTDGNFTSSADSSISVTSAGSGTTHGISLYGNASGENNGSISVSAQQNAVGLYAEQTSSEGFTNTGAINVTSDSGVGIYANGYVDGTNDRYIKIINSGDITISGDNATGIIADGSKTTVVNTGTITLNGSNGEQTSELNGGTITDTASTSLSIRNGANLSNYGKIISKQDINFDDFKTSDATIISEKDSTIKATSVSGELLAGSSITTGSNQNNYRNINAVEAQENTASITSNSAMFTASWEKNEQGNYNIVMNRSSFQDLLTDTDMAEYLEQNYIQGSRVDLFDNLKSSSTTSQLSSAVDDTFGRNFIPSLSWQNQQRTKYFNRSMEDLLINNPPKKNERIVVTSNNYYQEQKSQKDFQGYEEKIYGVTGLFDKALSPNIRSGLGLGIYHTDADYDDNDSRTDSIIQLYNPYSFSYRNFGAIIMPHLGYSHGEYTRYANGNKYEPDIDAYYYGISNRAYLKLPLVGLTIEPTVELNLSGIYQDRIKEDKGISTKSQNNLSAESGIGIYAIKEIEFDNGNKLDFRIGGMYYRELNQDAYNSPNAEFYGMSGCYQLPNYDNRRDRGIISIKGNYNIGNLNFYAEGIRLLESNDNMIYNAGVRINF